MDLPTRSSRCDYFRRLRRNSSVIKAALGRKGRQKRRTVEVSRLDEGKGFLNEKSDVRTKAGLGFTLRINITQMTAKSRMVDLHIKRMAKS